MAERWGHERRGVSILQCALRCERLKPRTGSLLGIRRPNDQKAERLLAPKAERGLVGSIVHLKAGCVGRRALYSGVAFWKEEAGSRNYAKGFP